MRASFSLLLLICWRASRYAGKRGELLSTSPLSLSTTEAHDDLFYYLPDLLAATVYWNPARSILRLYGTLSLCAGRSVVRITYKNAALPVKYIKLFFLSLIKINKKIVI